MKKFIYLLFIMFWCTTSQAKEIKIVVWTQGGEFDNFRLDNIKDASQELNKKLIEEGAGIQVRVEGRTYVIWPPLKKDFLRYASTTKGPNILVGEHEDIAFWAKNDLIHPFGKLADLTVFPFNDIYPALWKTTQWHGKSPK